MATTFLWGTQNSSSEDQFSSNKDSFHKTLPESWLRNQAILKTINFAVHTFLRPIPMTERSKARIRGRSLAATAVSNPAGSMDVSLLWVLCVFRQRSLRRANRSSKGVLPTVVSHCVWPRNLKNEAALARFGLLRQKNTLLWFLATRVVRGKYVLWWS